MTGKAIAYVRALHAATGFASAPLTLRINGQAVHSGIPYGQMTRFTTVDEGTALSLEAVTAAGAVVGTLTYTLVPSRFYAFSLTDNGVFAQKRQADSVRINVIDEGTQLAVRDDGALIRIYHYASESSQTEIRLPNGNVLGSVPFGQSTTQGASVGQQSFPVTVTRGTMQVNAGNLNLDVEGGRQYTLIAIGRVTMGVSDPLTTPDANKYAIIVDDGKAFDAPLPLPEGATPTPSGGTPTPPGGNGTPTTAPGECEPGELGCKCDGGDCDGDLICRLGECVEDNNEIANPDESSDDEIPWWVWLLVALGVLCLCCVAIIAVAVIVRRHNKHNETIRTQREIEHDREMDEVEPIQFSRPSRRRRPSGEATGSGGVDPTLYLSRPGGGLSSRTRSGRRSRRSSGERPRSRRSSGNNDRDLIVATLSRPAAQSATLPRPYVPPAPDADSEEPPPEPGPRQSFANRPRSRRRSGRSRRRSGQATDATLTRPAYTDNYHHEDDEGTILRRGGGY